MVPSESLPEPVKLTVNGACPLVRLALTFAVGELFCVPPYISAGIAFPKYSHIYFVNVCPSEQKPLVVSFVAGIAPEFGLFVSLNTSLILSSFGHGHKSTSVSVSHPD